MTRDEIIKRVSDASAAVSETLSLDTECLTQYEVTALDKAHKYLCDFLYLANQNKTDPLFQFIPGAHYYVYYLDEDHVLDRHIICIENLERDYYKDLYAIVNGERYKVAFNSHSNSHFFKWHDHLVLSKDLVEKTDQTVSPK